ncbi:MAG: extracellular solute-binding protein [Lachnospiraceae bacterium]|nr:extracellular solute-binding protein [Lachnospiraceae bacterium]
MKRFGCLILIGTMVLGLISGCGKKEEVKVEEKSKAHTEVASEVLRKNLVKGAETLKPSKELHFDNTLKITGIGAFFGEYPREYEDCYLWPAIKKLTNAEVKVDWNEVEDYEGVIASTILMGKDNMPDIIVPETFGIMDMAKDELIVPLDDYLDEMPNIVKAVGEENMDKWRQADGHIYSFPKITNVQGAQTMMVRKDWLDKLNMKEPTTWNDWIRLWEGIRDNDMNGDGDTTDEIPLMMEQGDNGEMSMVPLLNAFGIKCSRDSLFCVLDDGTYTLTANHPRYKDFLKQVRMLYEEGLLDPDFENRNGDEMAKAMNENKVGTVFTWAERCRTSTEELNKKGEKDALWISTKPVKGPFGDQMLQERNMITNVWCITAQAYNEGKAKDIVKLFNWMYGEEGSNLYCYGIEGVSYDRVDGRPVLKDEMVNTGFTNYRKAGCQFEPFGGYFQEEAFMQCLFMGKNVEELERDSVEFYKGLAEVNQGLYYSPVSTLETESYVKHRSRLLTKKFCTLRNNVIKGKISTKEFWTEYRKLQEMGLDKMAEDGNKVYHKMD